MELSLPKEKSRIIELGEALQYFLERSQINVYLDSKLINLAKLFPLLTQGICLKSTLSNYINLYFFVNKLYTSSDNYYVTPDTLFEEAFDGDIAAQFYYYDMEDKQIKISMKTAIATHLIDEPLNSMEVVSIKCDINSFMFAAYYFQYIINVNHTISDDTTRIQELENEYSLISLLLSILTKQRSHNKEVNILELLDNNTDRILLIEKLQAIL